MPVSLRVRKTAYLGELREVLRVLLQHFGGSLEFDPREELAHRPRACPHEDLHLLRVEKVRELGKPLHEVGEEVGPLGEELFVEIPDLLLLGERRDEHPWPVLLHLQPQLLEVVVPPLRLEVSLVVSAGHVVHDVFLQFGFSDLRVRDVDFDSGVDLSDESPGFSVLRFFGLFGLCFFSAFGGDVFLFFFFLLFIFFFVFFEFFKITWVYLERVPGTIGSSLSSGFWGTGLETRFTFFFRAGHLCNYLSEINFNCQVISLTDGFDSFS